MLDRPLLPRTLIASLTASVAAVERPNIVPVLADDLAETTDLSAREPARLAELKTLLTAKSHAVRDESPVWPAWTFTGAEGRQIEWPEYVKRKQGGWTNR